MSVEHLPLFEVLELDAAEQLPASVDTHKFVSNDWILLSERYYCLHQFENHKIIGSEAAAAALTLFTYAIHARGGDNLSFQVQELLTPLAVVGRLRLGS